MICKHIKDAVQNKPVIGSLCGCFGKSHIQQRIQAGYARMFICVCCQVPAVGVDREIVILAKQFLTEALHGNIVAPFAALLLHELLQIISHFLLPVC